VQGGNLMSALGAVGQTVQSAALSTLADGTRQLLLVGSATWAAPAATIGDTLDLIGCRDIATGASLGIDGAWKIANVSTTNLTLVLPYAGSMELPADFTTVNCGGGLVRRTEMRVSYIRAFDFARERVEWAQRPITDVSASAPVYITGGTITSATANVQGAQANNATTVPQPVLTSIVGVSANPAAGTTARQQQAIGTLIGVPVTKPYAIPEAGFNASLALTATTAVAIQAAAGAGLKRHLTAVQAINTGTAVDLIILDGATERWRLTLPQNVPVAFAFPTEIVTTANTALNANLSAAGTVRANFQGYTAP
jgi:hypothetical protein